MDLPMPGSPPMSTMEPLTAPPPKTLSSSEKPVPKRSSSAVSMLSMLFGLFLVLEKLTAGAAETGASLNSLRLSQVLQEGH